MIAVVAPYSPIGRSSMVHLGAARKLEVIIGLLALRDPDIVLVNSAHNTEQYQPLKLETATIGGVAVREISLPCVPRRRLGKLLNLLHVAQALNAVLALGKPQLLWLYNGYAFECLFARSMCRCLVCPVVLEFEDWHFSRGRGLNPKPFIDWLAWRAAMPVISHVFAVNTELAAKSRPFTDRISLLPGIVPSLLARIAATTQPFNETRAGVTVGYFGGLTREKGADLVLELANCLPAGYRIEVTGAGELEALLAEKSRAKPQSLRYHGKVSEQKLYELIAGCDVILSPHSPISTMANGVFPFKVIEAVASGRLVISTPLPVGGLEQVLHGVHFIEHSSRALFEAVVFARHFYENTRDKVQIGAVEANLRFGESGFLAAVDSITLPQNWTEK